MKQWFNIFSGSVPGSDHRTRFRNNEDSYIIISSWDRRGGIVSDGCGSGEKSEIGSWAISRFVNKAIKDYDRQIGFKQLQNSDARTNGSVKHFTTWIEHSVTKDISAFGKLFSQDDSEFYSRYMLATFVGFLMFDNITIIFHFGDGIYYVRFKDGSTEYHKLEYPDNAPPYITYNVLTRGVLPEESYQYQKMYYQTFITNDIESLLIATDGMELSTHQIDELLLDTPKLAKLEVTNTAWLQQRLQKLGATKTKVDWENQKTRRDLGMFSDDTTAILAKRVQT